MVGTKEPYQIIRLFLCFRIVHCRGIKVNPYFQTRIQRPIHIDPEFFILRQFTRAHLSQPRTDHRKINAIVLHLFPIDVPLILRYIHTGQGLHLRILSYILQPFPLLFYKILRREGIFFDFLINIKKGIVILFRNDD